jgi:hypothetical protein
MRSGERCPVLRNNTNHLVNTFYLPANPYRRPYVLAFIAIIHIRTWHVSFSILIGRNSVAEWLIVASTYHLNSDPKWPALLIPMSVWLWLQTVLHTNCGLCPPPSLRFMISLILSQKLWINSILGLFFYSCTMNISDIVNWRPGSERGSVYA